MYFNDPVEAVRLINKFLGKKDWNSLVQYYYAENGDNLDLTESFFIRSRPPENHDPFGFWKYRHPFPCGFQYSSHHSIGDNLVEVTVYYEIDQGFGMISEAQDSFKLIRNKHGYQIVKD